jgi:hypothetical protein
VAWETERDVSEQQLGDDVLFDAIWERSAASGRRNNGALLRREPGWSGSGFQCRDACWKHSAGDGGFPAAGERDECELLLSLVWNGGI